MSSMIIEQTSTYNDDQGIIITLMPSINDTLCRSHIPTSTGSSWSQVMNETQFKVIHSAQDRHSFGNSSHFHSSLPTNEILTVLTSNLLFLHTKSSCYNLDQTVELGWDEWRSGNQKRFEYNIFIVSVRTIL